VSTLSTTNVKNASSGSNNIVLAADGSTTITTLTGTTITGTSVRGGITSGTVVASTSGTSIDFTSIPSYVKRITVIFSAVSTNGSSVGLIRLGTSGSGIIATGYASGGVYAGIGTSGGNNTTGFFFTGSATAAGNSNHGQAVLTNITGNTWVQSYCMGQSDAGYALIGGGSVTLSGTLDRVRITTSNGTDTFDAGSINISYEG